MHLLLDLCYYIVHVQKDRAQRTETDTSNSMRSWCGVAFAMYAACSFTFGAFRLCILQGN